MAGGREVLDYLKDIGLIAGAVYFIYDFFFKKSKNDLGLSSDRIKLLKEIQDLREGEVRKLLDDYKRVSENEDGLKTLLDEQDNLLKKYKRRNAYLKSVLMKNGISFDADKD